MNTHKHKRFNIVNKITFVCTYIMCVRLEACLSTCLCPLSRLSTCVSVCLFKRLSVCSFLHSSYTVRLSTLLSILSVYHYLECFLWKRFHIDFFIPSVASVHPSGSYDVYSNTYRVVELIRMVVKIMALKDHPASSNIDTFESLFRWVP